MSTTETRINTYLGATPSKLLRMIVAGPVLERVKTRAAQAPRNNRLKALSHLLHAEAAQVCLHDMHCTSVDDLHHDDVAHTHRTYDTLIGHLIEAQKADATLTHDRLNASSSLDVQLILIKHLSSEGIDFIR